MIANPHGSVGRAGLSLGPLWVPAHSALLGGSRSLVVLRQWCTSTPRHLRSIAEIAMRHVAQLGMAALCFEERGAPLIDREVHARNDRKLVRRLRNADRKSPTGVLGWRSVVLGLSRDCLAHISEVDQRSRATLCVQAVPGERVVGGDMKPLALAGHTQA
jgi:hypothetical protein